MYHKGPHYALRKLSFTHSPTASLALYPIAHPATLHCKTARWSVKSAPIELTRHLCTPQGGKRLFS